MKMKCLLYFHGPEFRVDLDLSLSFLSVHLNSGWEVNESQWALFPVIFFQLCKCWCCTFGEHISIIVMFLVFVLILLWKAKWVTEKERSSTCWFTSPNACFTWRQEILELSSDLTHEGQWLKYLSHHLLPSRMCVISKLESGTRAWTQNPNWLMLPSAFQLAADQKPAPGC